MLKSIVSKMMGREADALNDEIARLKDIVSRQNDEMAACRDVLSLQKKMTARRAAAPKTYAMGRTIELLETGLSCARYGDGEFNLCCDLPYAFGRPNEKLDERLRHILKHGMRENPRCLVCISDSLFASADDFWIEYSDRMFDKIIPLLDPYLVYGATGITRVLDEKSIAGFRRIWDGKKVVFVVPSKGRFIDEPRLFDNIAQKAFVDIPPMEAFAEYDRILSDCKKFPVGEGWLFYIAAGAVATLLAYDLSLLGYQALDLGHLPNILRHCLDGAPMPEQTAKVKE
ncbi:MAG: GT-D fold domain-containing glycosyltransferase [Alphaproteobacteria bacterium]|nr:GT-D fold domain-containing glycosyltransferase [Alphaproteobacteria bacterium]